MISKELFDAVMGREIKIYPVFNLTLLLKAI
jgi:hypothetical protein